MTAMKKKERVMTDGALELIAGRFKVLAEPMRLKILNALERREMTVTELVEATGATQANVSKHLGILLDSHFVTRRKSGLNAFYSIHDESVFYLCDAVCESLGERLAEQQTAVKSFGRK
jgi:DNA-binding transcriptional ArsR family regulator